MWQSNGGSPCPAGRPVLPRTTSRGSAQRHSAWLGAVRAVAITGCSLESPICCPCPLPGVAGLPAWRSRVHELPPFSTLYYQCNAVTAHGHKSHKAKETWLHRSDQQGTHVCCAAIQRHSSAASACAVLDSGSQARKPPGGSSSVTHALVLPVCLVSTGCYDSEPCSVGEEEQHLTE